MATHIACHWKSSHKLRSDPAACYEQLSATHNRAQKDEVLGLWITEQNRSPSWLTFNPESNLFSHLALISTPILYSALLQKNKKNHLLSIKQSLHKGGRTETKEKMRQFTPIIVYLVVFQWCKLLYWALSIHKDKKDNRYKKKRKKTKTILLMQSDCKL